MEEEIKKEVMDPADKIDASQKRYFQSDKGKAAVKRYIQSEKGKASQAKHYRDKVRPGHEVAQAFRNWLEKHPGGTPEEFLKSSNGGNNV